MFFNNKFNTFFGLNLTLVYTFPMCMAWRFHFPIRNYDFKQRLSTSGPQCQESRKLTTINTTKCLFEYVHFRMVSRPRRIYQRITEQLLQNIPMTVIYLDDILISGSTPEEHDRNLRIVLSRLLDKGLRLRKEECVFRQKWCRYLGHVIDEEGIHRTDDKVMAIKNAPVQHLFF